MKKRKRTGIAVLALIGLFISSGMALADPLETEEEPTDSEVLADTLFSFGYDLINGLLLWNISSVDEPCTLPTGDGSEPDPDADPECELTGGEVAGPNGQVNHGMFMKLFNSLYDGNSRGCVIRHLAQSDLGKGDQQVKVGDETDVETEETDDTAPIDFTTVEADCEKGGADTGLEDSNGNGNGKPDSAGKPESPGKSASAPGKNK
jgi:hypothetical protein